MTDGSISRATYNNNWDRPTGDLSGCFAALWTSAGGRVTAKSLQLKSTYKLPCVPAIDFQGNFPQAFVDYPDQSLPVSLSLRAFSPVVPHDVKNSALPLAYFVFRITNESRASVEGAVAVSWENILGVGGSTTAGSFSDRTGNTVAAFPSRDGIFGLRMAAPDLPAELPNNRLRYNASAGASYALACQATRPDWRVTTASWNSLSASPEWWPEFANSGTVSGETAKGIAGKTHPAGVVAVRFSLKARDYIEIPFVFAWFTPRLWTTDGHEYGHQYEQAFDDSVATARYAFENRLMLQTLTDDWQRRLLRSSLPGWLAARLINDASTLFTNTILTQDSGLGGSQPGPGLFAMLESPVDGEGRLGAIQHRLVSGGLMARWFPDLAQSELRLFKAAQAPTGWIPRSVGNLDVRIGAPFNPEATVGPDDPLAAAAYTCQVYEYFQATGDKRFLDEFYPSAKHAIEYVAKLAKASHGLPAGPPFDDPSGPPAVRAETATIWLAALACCRAMADQMNDKRFSADCGKLLDTARAAVVQTRWNGKHLRVTSLVESCSLLQTLGLWEGERLGFESLLPADIALKISQSLVLLGGAVATAAAADGKPGDAAIWPPYLSPCMAALKIRHDKPEMGVATLKRVNDVAYDSLGLPFGAPLALDRTLTKPVGNGRHMAWAASWSVLDDLEGFAFDAPKGRLTLNPRIPADWKELSAPIFAPSMEAWLDYKPGLHKSSLSFRFDRFIQAAAQPTKRQTGSDLLVREIVLPPFPAGSDVSLSLSQAPLNGHLTFQPERTVFALESPITLVAGAKLQIAVKSP